MSPADLYYARGQLGLTVRALARELDVAPSTVSRWESGAQPIPRLAECAVNWLLVRQTANESDAIRAAS
jgi:transcriptional regulator with XRE-family HTH domain